jgi:hypothetical protein
MRLLQSDNVGCMKGIAELARSSGLQFSEVSLNFKPMDGLIPKKKRARKAANTEGEQESGSSRPKKRQRIEVPISGKTKAPTQRLVSGLFVGRRKGKSSVRKDTT